MYIPYSHPHASDATTLTPTLMLTLILLPSYGTFAITLTLHCICYTYSQLFRICILDISEELTGSLRIRHFPPCVTFTSRIVINFRSTFHLLVILKIIIKRL